MGSFRVDEIFSIEGRGIALIGQCVEGEISLGMQALINAKQAKIVGIETNNSEQERASVGQDIAVIVNSITKDDPVAGQSYAFG